MLRRCSRLKLLGTLLGLALLGTGGCGGLVAVGTAVPVPATPSAVAAPAPSPTRDPAHEAFLSNVEAARAQAGRPNILLISIDGLRADRLGSYGNARIRTPNMDGLAEKGVRFAFPIAPFSQTNPTFASLFTGVYASTHGLRHHGVNVLDGALPTLAEVLGRAGYNTAAIYSWPSLDPDESGLQRGFDLYQRAYVPVAGQEDYWRSWDGRADATTDAVITWLSRSPQQPFFLWLHYFDPHFPYDPPIPFDTMYDPDCRGCLDGSWRTIDSIVNGLQPSERDIAHLLALYDGEISFTDQQIGRLLSRMSSSGLLDTTIVVLTADEGESFYDNQVWFHPWILYNSVVRVPLLISFPPRLPVGLVIQPAVSLVDVMPTLLEMVGLPAPPASEGRSLLPLMLGKEAGSEGIALVQTLDDSSTAIVSGGWKLIRHHVEQVSELYEMSVDPGEKANLVHARPEIAQQLEERLARWMSERGIVPPPSPAQASE